MESTSTYTASLVCHTLSYPRSSYYYWPQERDEELKAAIEQLAAEWPTYSYCRLTAQLRRDGMDLSEYQDYHDAYCQIGRFLEGVYIRKRVHSSLGYITPVEFEEQWLKQQLTAELIR